MNDNDQLIGGEAINAETIGLPKSSPVPKIKKQYLIIGGVAIVILILTIVIVVLATKGNGSSGGSGGEGGGEGSKQDDHDPSDAIGIINVDYRIGSTTSPTQLISENYNKDSAFSIYINDKFVVYSKKYTFKSRDNQKVKFVVYEEINMNKMFKDVKEITGIEITSDKNMKIKSLDNAFENCENLAKFQMTGVDSASIGSIKNAFRNTNIKDISNVISSLGEIKDMSYMFAGTKLNSIDLSKLDTSKVTNMAGLFQDSQSLGTLDLSNFKTSNVEDMSSMFEGIHFFKSFNFFI